MSPVRKLKCAYYFLLALVMFIISVPAVADTALWKITKDGATVYLGGTVHVLSAADYPLPEAFDQAYDQSDVVYFEVDIAELSDSEIASTLQKESVYPPGITLKSKLTAETWARLDTYLQGRGLAADQVNNLRPGALMSTLMSIELMRLGITGGGVDHHYFEQSVRDGKRIGSFETAAQQVQLLTRLGAGNEDEFLQYLLEDMSDFSVLFSRLKDAWLHGDVEKLADLSRLEEMKLEDPDTYGALVESRNRNWFPVVESLFETSEVELVLVGALHLAGDDGLLQLLSEKGYQLQQLLDH